MSAHRPSPGAREVPICSVSETVRVAHGPSEALQELAMFALDHAAGSVIPDGGPLVPFVLLDVGGDVNLARFEGDMEEGQAAARALVRATPGLTGAAVAWDGYLTADGLRLDAVFVEAFTSEDTASITLAQRYRPVEPSAADVEAFGDPLFVAEGDPLF